MKIILLSPGHISSNPRLVKSADALAAEGHDVHVITLDTFAPALIHDRELMLGRRWTKTSRWAGAGSLQYIARKVMQRVAWFLSVIGLSWFDCRALSTFDVPLRKLVSAYPADLYIGHNLAALGVVAAAAKRRQAMFAFDVEDFHPGESSNETDSDFQWRLKNRILGMFLPSAAFVTASSPLIAKEVSSRYEIDEVVSILNVFPLPDDALQALDSEKRSRALRRRNAKLNFYWFSQTVGAGRGLEQVFKIFGRLSCPIRIDLRGHVSECYKTDLIASAANFPKLEICFLPVASPDAMVSLARAYDAGISAEISDNYNRDICLTNKVFTYLAAGIPCILSNTRAHKNLSGELLGAAVVVDLEDVVGSAGILNKWLDSPWEIRASTALAVAIDKFSWQKEQCKLISLVNRCAV